MRDAFRLGVLTVAVATALACGPSIDLTTALRIDGLSSGWSDAGYADGLYKITPSVSFRITNTSPSRLEPLHVNAVFRRVGQAAEWAARFVPVAGSKGFQPGQSTALVLTSDLGYTSFDPVDEMLRNSQFVDADVDLFARHGSSPWVKLATYRVERQLIEPRSSWQTRKRTNASVPTLAAGVTQGLTVNPETP
jgi:hypothetical protein